MSVSCTARVLVIENDPRARHQLIEILTRPGYLLRAADGQGLVLQENAKRLATIFRPHVVVMDLRLLDDEYGADRSGLKLLKEECFSSSRCVLHSAYLNYDYKVTRDALVEARVVDVVGKEESPRSLIRAVEKAAREDCICRREFSIQWPASWDEEAVINTLFKEHFELPSDMVMDILGHLFPEARTVILKTLKGTEQSSTSVYRGRAVLFQAWTDNNEPFVVKLAPRDRTDKEVAAYREYIRNRLVGRFYAQLEDHKVFWELGGICYSFIGSSQKTMETFADFYRHKTAEEIISPLQHFYKELWSRHYAESQTSLVGSLFDAYDSFLKLTQRLGKPGDYEETVTFEGLPGKYPNPLRWILEHKDESLIQNAMQAVTHGDLHGDNLFIEEDHAWAIDFERTKPGPILRDFVELEVDILTRIARLRSVDLVSYKNLAVILSTPNTPKDSFGTFGTITDREIKKLLTVIQALRTMACEITAFSDIREYYWGLLFDTVFSLLSARKESLKWQRGLLFASTLCTRLSQWGHTRPFEEYQNFDEI